MRTRRKFILLALCLCSVLIVYYAFSRAPSAPVTITLFGKQEPANSPTIFVITNSSPKELRWISIVEVGGPDKWHPAAKQPKPTKVDPQGFRTLPAHSAHWLPVSVPEEGGSWRV